MKCTSLTSLLAVAAAALPDAGLAFSPLAAPSSLTSGTHRRQSPTQIHSIPDKDRIKKAGAGITTQTAGNFSVYDPNENGKLQGSDTLMERIESGATFSLPGSPPPQATPSAPATPPPPTSPPEPDAKPKQNSFTTNLTKLLNGELEARFRGGDRSQY